MDAAEFRKSTPPATRRSKLASFLPDLRLLQADGYTLAQLCAFLASNNVTTTRSNVSAFLARSVAPPSKRAAPNHRKTTPAPLAPTAPLAVSPPEPQETTPQQPVAVLPSKVPAPAPPTSPGTWRPGSIAEIARSKPDMVGLAKKGREYAAQLAAEKKRKADEAKANNPPS